MASSKGEPRMAKARRNERTHTGSRGTSPAAAEVPTAALAPSAGAGRTRWTCWGLALAAALAFAWGLLCWRAAHHYRFGTAAARQGRTLEAAREFESAVGFYAPLNPYARAAAEQMLALASGAEKKDPRLSREILDRFWRSVRSTRWLVQPYSDLLARFTGGTPSPLARDPSAPLFFGAIAGLAVGLGIWWLPLRPAPKGLLGTAGLLLWATLLYLC